MKATLGKGSGQTTAYTLMELVCTMAIIGLMAALLLPTVSKGYARARRIYCINSLRQTGLAFHGFAHGHEDQFPTQVSTNRGGTREWLQAASRINEEFYFSYRHFLPLANDLHTPKVLACPADERQAATDFGSFHNENLSYFVAANPEFGKPDSILAGDRNLSPTFGSVARIGGALYLKWTRELHQFKGNVLFADGHVEQMKDILRVTNATSTKVDNLLVPSVPSLSGPANVSLPIVNQGLRGGAGSNAATARFVLTNLASASNLVQTRTASSRKPGSPAGSPSFSTSASTKTLSAENEPDDAAAPETMLIPSSEAQFQPAAAQFAEPDAAKTTYHRAVSAGRKAFVGTVATMARTPWYLILVLLLVMWELRRRIRKRQRQRARVGEWPIANRQ